MDTSAKGGHMPPLFQKADDLSRQVIGAATEVHCLKGSGLIESIYVTGSAIA